MRARALIRRGRGLLARLQRDRRGTLPVELALVLPVMMLLLVGAADVTWLYIANQKVTRAAGVLADLTARAAEIRTADVTDLFDAAREVVAPLDFAANGQAYVSSIANADGNGARVSWQLASADGLSAASRVGTRGGTADLGGVITVEAREELIVAETFLEVEPLFGLLIQGPTRLYVRALQRPRFGTVVLRQD
jgi:hypothetical protein